jgi:glycosyltransferase involved in cell wall biosynthesis
MPHRKPSQSEAVDEAAALQLSLLIPVYNEEGALAGTVDAVRAALDGVASLAYEVVCIDDGSGDGSPALLAQLEASGRIRLVRHRRNRGYGAALQSGARASHGAWIGMIDADGTYPAESLPPLLQAMAQGADMAVGARTGAKVNIPVVRRPAKWVLNCLANYLTGTRIPDLNSGLRIVKRERFDECRRLLPEGFSLTTTITLALLTRGCDVVFLPIDYHKRVGQSSIRPIRDTLKFAQLIVRTVLYFRPLKVFVPLAGGLFAAAAAVALVSKYVMGQLMDVTSILLLMSALQMLATGMLADLIDKRMD